MKRLKFNTAAISLRLLLVAGFVAGLLAVTIAPRVSNALLMAIDSTSGLTQSLPAAGTESDGAPNIDALSGSISSPTVLVTFSPGSLIIPMDIALSGQDNGMLRAYGLVYELLRNGVPVSWVINPAKAVNGDDFTISLSNALQDVRTGATISPRSYRGGPFVIAASDAAMAQPIIQAWQTTPGDNTAVHRLTSGSFTPDVARTLIRAPRIAVLKDGNEAIAFNNLNSAGISDSVGALWSSSSPDLLTEAEVAGPTTSNHSDGILFHGPGGLNRYCYIASMHYATTALTPEVVQEFRSSLDATSLAHAFMQCDAIRPFENDVAGHFLTTLGLVDDGSATASPLIRVPSHPLAQLDGAFEADLGAVDSIGLAASSTFRTGVQTIINDSASSILQRIVLLSGRLDGISGNSKVTYLAGHDYSLVLPISANPQTNGVRLFLNSIFESDCAADSGQPDVTLTNSAPALINTSTITYTISYMNPGPRTVENVHLIDQLPIGTTYVASSGIPAPTTTSGGILTWDLPPLASGANASVTFQVSVTTDGTYTNTAQMAFATMTVRQVSSNSVTTIRDTMAPSVTIIAGPAGTTNDTTPSFRFTTDATAVTKECGIDNANFTACSPDPAQYTSVPLADGPHTFNVRVKDAADNTASASRAFTVDTTPMAPTFTNATAASFTLGTAGAFTVTTSGSPSATISESGALPSGVTFISHADGTGTLSGTPTASGTFPITFTASNGVPPDAMQSFTLTVKQAPTITSAAAATFTVGTAGSFTVTTSGFPSATISESGALPGGVSFIPHANGTGTLSGTPTASGTFPITFTASNGVPPNAMQAFTLTVTASALVAIEVTPTNPTVPVGHSLPFTATGTFSDGSNQDLTDSVTWSSSDHAVAAISNASGAKGVATGLHVGTTQIEARSGAVSDATTLTVTAASPTLGNYPDTSIPLSTDTTVTPDAPPTNTTNINVSTSTNFKGKLEGDPATGIVRVTDAHPEGIYTVTVTAFDGVAGPSTTKTFTLTVTTPETCNPVTFEAVTNFGTGVNPSAAAVGDFNRDGQQDLAVTNFNSGFVSIFLGNGAGNFTPGTNVPAASVSNSSVAVGDFNGDGKQDLAVTHYSGPTAGVLIFLGDGAGTFGAGLNLPANGGPVSVVVGDFNSDGRQDLAAANQDSNDVSILLGNGDGTFSAAVNFGAGVDPNYVTTGDFNGDGKQDLAVANYISDNVSILLGDGLGGFSAAANFTTDDGPVVVAMGDFNGDGKQDLAVVNQTSNNVSIRLGDGMGGFSAATNFDANTLPTSIAMGDFNGDGKPDLAVANAGSNNVSLFLGDGAGSFALPINLGTGTGPYAVVVGDFTGDGKQDLAVANVQSSDVSILLRNCAPPPTPTPAPTPTLGNYPDTSVPLSGNTTVTPDAPPANTTSITVSTSTQFKGTFAANAATGIVTVTDAHPVGTYTVAVTAFGPGGTTTKTFTLTVTSTPCGAGFTAGFTNAANANTGTNPYSEAIGDFNGDGNQDLAVANTNSNTVSIRLGDGLGGFGGSTNVSVGTNPRSLVIGDFNGDGNQDLAVANASSGTVSIRLGDGSGGFGGSTAVIVGSVPQWVAVGDFNGDGKQDLAVANTGSSTVSIRLGDGLGGFSSSPDLSMAFPLSIAVGDFDSDGRQDLAISSGSSNNVSIRLGDGLGGFSTSPNVSVGSDPLSVTTGDFNGDGNQDLAVANYGSNTVSIRLGDGLGGFTGSTNVSVGAQPTSVAIGDFNGDGNQDLATSNFNSNNVSIRLGDGLGGFSSSTNVSAGSGPASVAIGDFNGDGRQDLAVVNYSSSTVSIRLGQCIPGPTPTPTPPPFVSISGQVTYCPNADPVPGVTMSLTGPSPAPSSTPTDGSGNYTLSALTPGGTYTVTPSKDALPPGSAGIDTVDVIAAQRHYLTLALIPPGCGRDAANVNGDNRIDTSDVVAIQRFFLGRPFGFANVGKYQFTPASRSYPGIATDQAGQDYGALVLGDIVAAYVHRSGGHRPGGPSQDAAGDDTSANEVPATVAAVSLPEIAVAQSRSSSIAAVTTTAIDAKNKLVGFQGDFRFDERVVTFQSEPVQKAGLTAGNWNVSGNVLSGSGPIRTLRVSAFSNDFTPLSGTGTLFELRMRAVSDSALRIPNSEFPLLWAEPQDPLIFIDVDLKTQKPGSVAPGSVTSATSSVGRGR